MKLLNSTELAKELGVSTWIPNAVKAAARESGDSPFIGRYTTVEKFVVWLERRPDFVASRALRRR